MAAFNFYTMLGIILCGGLSSRMGTDKGLLQFNTTRFAWNAREKMSSLKFPVVLSVNQDQFPEYATHFSKTELIKDHPALAVRGPLCGLLSVHLQYPQEDLFVLACDMPLMETDLLQELYSVYASKAASEAFVFTNNGEPEPLCAIYKAKGLAHILDLLKSNQLKRHSMKLMIEQLEAFLIPLKKDQKKYFININTQADLNRL